jgi:hypothetical protein
MNDLTRSADLAAFTLFTRWLLSGLALAVGILGISAVWLALAMLSGSPCSWLALFAAADMALMLRLTQAPPGGSRRLAAAIATALAIAISQWFIAATYMGESLGLAPLDSASRLGPVLAWAMTVLNLRGMDWALILISLPLAAWWAGNGRKF